LLGDALRIQQVALNLLGNSVKFTDRGEIELVVKWHDDSLHFEVRDTGPGVDEHQLEELFKPFVQGGDPKSHQQGTGLGLAISRDLVELMRGSLTATSNGKSGSVFRFAVPSPRVAPPAKDQGITLPLATPRSVMIVDDNDINLMLAMKLLEREGYTVRLARDGEQALAMIEHSEPDVILMDIQMPGLDGLETTRALRRRGSKVAVIALTANAMQEDRECCIAAGMNGYLSKPFDVKALHAVMCELNVH
jgi:CheY-like chemotaxis protein